jgi:hypothetical protein
MDEADRLSERITNFGGPLRPVKLLGSSPIAPAGLFARFAHPQSPVVSQTPLAAVPEWCQVNKRQIVAPVDVATIRFVAGGFLEVDESSCP